MKIAVVGCGALGSYYGAKLLRAGHAVHFLLRTDYETVRRRGVRIESPEGNFHASPRCATAPSQIGPSDLVLIGLKTTANHLFAEYLPPLHGPETIFLTLQNGLGNEAELAQTIPASQIMGGLCFVCLNRSQPGIIQHLAHGRVTLGEYSGWPEPRTHDVASYFREAGVPCKVTENLEQAHWEKLMWNIPFNGLGVASAAGFDAFSSNSQTVRVVQPCLTTDKLLADPRWANLVEELMQEILDTANHNGLAIKNDLIPRFIALTREMSAYKPSTLLDFENGLPLEMESMFLKPLRAAAPNSQPRLKRLCEILQALDPARGVSVE